MQFSPQQSAAIDAVGRWIKKRDPQVFRLFGYAGTGKSTLAKHLAATIGGKVMFAAFTGKAALVMRQKGCPNASTIHSMIYTCRPDDRGHVHFEIDHDAEVSRASLIVIDEVSMVNRSLGEDLLSFGVPILVLGDPAQLPPVDRGKDPAGFFTLAKPDVMLTEIHRQSRDNPIIALATDVREGRTINYGDFGRAKVIAKQQVNRQEILAADQILCGLNRTRQLYNERMRALLGMAGEMPCVGDKLVCLKNNHEKGLLNGSLWKVSAVVEDNGREIVILVDSEEFSGMARQEVKVPKSFFLGKDKDEDWRYLLRMDQMTYGYALTVHKSQGSQFDDVYLFDESSSFREDCAKHLYTGITRAAETITIVR